jgi:hypothetical protein
VIAVFPRRSQIERAWLIAPDDPGRLGAGCLRTSGSSRLALEPAVDYARRDVMDLWLATLCQPQGPHFGANPTSSPCGRFCGRVDLPQ